jgi:L-threonylcarbamoyladenylate synthase
MANVLQIDFEQPDTSSKAIEKIESILNSGGVIAFPTDTFYGLGADPFNPAALAKIFKIKQRPADKPLLVLIYSLVQLADLTTEVNDNARKLMEHFWPGSLTLIFKASPRLPDILTAGTGKIGIRLPSHPFTHKFLETLDRPLTAPSANLSGERELRTAQEVERALGDKIDLIIDGGPAPGGKPSTVLDTTTNPPTLIREGALSRSELETVLLIQ